MVRLVQLSVMALLAGMVPVGGQTAEPASMRERLEAAANAYQAGRAAKAAGDRDAARRHLEEAVRLHPSDGEAWWVLAWVRAELGYARDAADAFDKAAQLLIVGDARRAEARRQIEKLAGRQATDDDRQAAETLFAQGSQAKQEGRAADALDLLQRAVGKDPDHGRAWWFLAWVKREAGDLIGAQEAFDLAARRLSDEDGRKKQAQEQADLLWAELARRAGPPKLIAPRSPETYAVPLLSGWPGGLLAVTLLVCLLASGRALLANQQEGPRCAAAAYRAAYRQAIAGRPAAVGPLLAALRDPALAFLPPADVRLALTRLATASSEARSRLVARLPQASGREQSVLARVIAEVGGAPPETWAKLLVSPDRELVLAAVTALRREPTSAASDRLAELAAGDDLELATASCAALASLGDEATGQLSVLAATAATGEVRTAAIAALATVRALDEASLARLLPLLADPATPGRPHLVEALASAGQPAATALVEALLDDSPPVRERAREALLANRFGHFVSPDPDLVQPLLEVDPERLTDEALAVIERHRPAAVVDLLKRLLLAGEATVAQRVGAVEALAKRGSAEADAVLVEAVAVLPVAGDDGLPGELASELLAAVGRRRLVAALPNLLSRAAAAGEVEQELCLAAARQLRTLPGAGEVVVAALADPRLPVRRAAVALLGEPAPVEASEHLLALLTGPDPAALGWPTLRQVAVAVGQLQLEAAVEQLRQLHDRHLELRDDGVTVALARLGDEAAIAAVEAMLRRDHWRDRLPAADYYREVLHAPKAARRLVSQADAIGLVDQMVAEAGEQADGLTRRLVQIGERAVPYLTEMMVAGRCRAEAARALQALGEPEAGELARAYDQIDALAAADLADAAVRAQLAELARSRYTAVVDYLGERLGTDLLADLLATSPSGE